MARRLIIDDDEIMSGMLAEFVTDVGHVAGYCGGKMRMPRVRHIKKELTRCGKSMPAS